MSDNNAGHVPPGVRRPLMLNPSPGKVPTGIEFLDRAMQGGQDPEGIHGLLGPIGVGKSTLGAMIAAEGTLVEGERARGGQDNGC